MSGEPSLFLFAYGMLQLPQVQASIYGRRLEGRPDAMLGWLLVPLEISDSEVVRLSGLAVHSIARHTGKVEDRISDTVFQLLPEEPEATDRYEVDAYGRIAVALESGITAVVYVGADS